MRLDDLGEFGLIERIRTRVGDRGAMSPAGIGDDAAVIDVQSNQLLVSTDTFLEGVHFRTDYLAPRQIGWKAAAGTLSDIAAMGGAPRHLFLALGAPGRTEVEMVDGIIEGMLELAGRHGVELVGGDTIASPDRILLSLTVTGTLVADRPITRDGASPGDKVLVTGNIGGSRAGLLLLQRGLDWADHEGYADALARHRAPEPRIEEARLLASRFPVSAAIDISDGLLSEAAHLARQSGVGVVLWEPTIPVSKGAQVISKSLGRSPVLEALASGEEYELLFTAPADCVDELRRTLLMETGTIATAIGEIITGSGVSVRGMDGQEIRFTKTGHDHFSPDPE